MLIFIHLKVLVFFETFFYKTIKMGKCKDICEDKKAAIVALLDAKNFSFREIARKAKVSHQTVMRINKKLHENQRQVNNKRRNCGKKRKTTPRVDRRIIQKACENRFLSTRSLHQDLLDEGIEISSMTLRRRLYEANLKSRRPVKKPKLTPKMRKARLEFALAHQHYTIPDWKKVINIYYE